MIKRAPAPGHCQDLLAGRTIGVLTALVGGDYFGTLVTSLAKATSALGGRCFAVQTQSTEFVEMQTDSRPYARLSRLSFERVDAFIVLVASLPVSVLESIREAGLPIVLVSHDPEGFPCPVVMPDNITGTKEALLHLIRHGHERIAFAGDLGAEDMRERYEAYQQVVREHGLPELVFPADSPMHDGGRRCGKALLDAGLPSTAVFAACDHNAVGIMEVLREAGLRLPHDQAVVGFDDMPGAGLADLPLSTVRQDFAAIASEAVRLVTEMLHGKEVQPGRYRAPTSLVVRESCGCAGASNQPQPAAEGVATTGSCAPMAGDQAQLVTQVEDIMRRCASSNRADDLDMIELKQAAQALYGRLPKGQAFSFLAWAHELASRLDEPGERNVAPGRGAGVLSRCLAELGAGLARGAAAEDVAEIGYLTETAARDYAMSVELLQGGRFDPRSLEWARHIKMGAAVLATWQQGTGAGQQMLEIEGFYGGEPLGALALGSAHPAPAFPPAEMLDEYAGPGSMWLLLPVRTISRDWGYLAVLSDMELIVVNQDRYFQWAAMLAQALDHHGLTVNLRRRNEELCESVEREHRMALAVAASEERYALAAKAANDALWDWDLVSGAVYFSPRWREMLGYEAKEVTATPEEWLDRAHGEDRPLLMGALGKAMAGETPTFQDEHRIQSAAGTYLWVQCRALAVCDAGGRPVRLVGSLSDITERRRLQDQLTHQALYDNLTGLPNRALFLDRLSQAIAVSRRHPNNVFAVLWLDLDGFKQVNDTLGHLAGDQLLVQVAHRLSGHLRASDTAARFGGDEFGVLLQYLPDEAAAVQIAARALADLSEPYDLGDETVSVSASVGVSCSVRAYERAEDAIRDADVAMYRAKSSGANRIVVYEPYMADDAVSRLHAQSALRKAMDSGQLEMAYRPVLSLITGELWALEAMPIMRGGPGDRSPGRAAGVDAATETRAYEMGLSEPLGLWAQKEACRQLARWKSSCAVGPRAHVILRLSGADLWSPATPRRISEVVEATGAEPGSLWFEADHSVVMSSLETAITTLSELPCGGFVLCMDDIEGRRSFIAALRRLPISALKIHRDVVASLADPTVLAVARRTVDAAHKLNVPVVAEGVATPACQRLLEDMGCQYGQGYWFSRPLRGDEVQRVLAVAPSASVS
ncbi:MAG TPA: diguanylate cyclase [Acidimicrobiales bacterium]|nr:diguanylate cyclase [Acidimicrobiales bacterium]